MTERTETGERRNAMALLDDMQSDWKQPEREDLIQSIHFSRSPRNGEAYIEVYYPTHRRQLLQAIVLHSPDGFEFGYGGSGPADAALNILLLFVTEGEARKLHQDFKWAFVATVDHEAGGQVSAKAIRCWLEEQLRYSPGYQIWTAEERGVAMVLLGYDLETAAIFDNPDANPWWQERDVMWPDFRGRKPWACPVPKAVRYAWMFSKACAFMDGYYVALRQNGSDLVRKVESGQLHAIPHYDAVKWRILDGDGFDDENVEGGDYILAARIALHLTATRYAGLRDPDFITPLGGI